MGDVGKDSGEKGGEEGDNGALNTCVGISANQTMWECDCFHGGSGAESARMNWFVRRHIYTLTSGIPSDHKMKLNVGPRLFPDI